MVVAPIFVARDLPEERRVVLEVGVPLVDTQPGGPVSPPDARAYALREVRVRLHQQRFRQDVLRAYRHRCTICALRERELVQAAHIVADPSPEGIAAVVNGLALCAIHHLAYDRNLLGIDPNGTVHIARRVREEHDGPMLREGIQGLPRSGDPEAGASVRPPGPGAPRSALCLLRSRRVAAGVLRMAASGRLPEASCFARRMAASFQDADAERRVPRAVRKARARQPLARQPL